MLEVSEFSRPVFSVLSLWNIYQVQCLAKPAAHAVLVFPSMMRTSSMMISGLCLFLCRKPAMYLMAGKGLSRSDDVFCSEASLFFSRQQSMSGRISTKVTFPKHAHYVTDYGSIVKKIIWPVSGITWKLLCSNEEKPTTFSLTDNGQPLLCVSWIAEK